MRVIAAKRSPAAGRAQFYRREFITLPPRQRGLTVFEQKTSEAKANDGGRKER